MSIWWLVLAGLIVLVLAGYAIYLHWLLRKREQKRQRDLAELELAAAQKREQINTSIQVLAKGCFDDKLTLTEASIRISVLLDSLSVDDAVREEFGAFYQLAEATKHIPFLDAWKKLSRKQQLAFDREREQLEKKYGDFVLDAARRIEGRDF